MNARNTPCGLLITRTRSALAPIAGVVMGANRRQEVARVTHPSDYIHVFIFLFNIPRKAFKTKMLRFRQANCLAEK